jgi:hypothetical protein
MTNAIIAIIAIIMAIATIVDNEMSGAWVVVELGLELDVCVIVVDGVVVVTMAGLGVVGLSAVVVVIGEVVAVVELGDVVVAGVVMVVIGCVMV